MVKFMLRKTRAVFPSLAVIITIITIIALKCNHLKDPAVNVRLKQKIETDAGHYFLGIYGRQFSTVITTRADSEPVKAELFIFYAPLDHDECLVHVSIRPKFCPDKRRIKDTKKGKW